MIKRAVWCSVFLLILSHAACDLFRPAQDLVAIRVGEKDITLDAFRKDLERIIIEMDLNTEEIRPVFDLLVERLVERYVITAHGEELGISVKEQELEAAVREIKADYPSEDEFNDMLLKRYVNLDVWKGRLREQLLIKKIIAKGMEQVKPVTVEEIQAHYEKNRDLYRHKDMIKFSQIITRNADEAADILELAKKGQDLGTLIQDTPERFSTAVGIPERWTADDEMDESFADALFSLPIGLASTPLKTPYGYHVVEVTARRPAGVKSLPEVMTQIEERLLSEKQEAFFSDWIETLKSRYIVKVNRDVLNKLEIG